MEDVSGLSLISGAAPVKGTAMPRDIHSVREGRRSKNRIIETGLRISCRYFYLLDGRGYNPPFRRSEACLVLIRSSGERLFLPPFG